MLFTNQLIAQDIEQVIKAPWLATNGGFTMSHIGNITNDSLNSMQPYSLFISGNINTKFFDVVDLPFSFSYTNDQVTKSLPQPFNRFTLSPSYKWIQTYIGYSSMNFSSYSLGGHEFLGGGVELTPVKAWKFSAMFGQLNKAVAPDSLGSDPYFKRLGGGLKVDYFNEKFDASIDVFKATDDKNSLNINNNDSLLIKPKDNIVAGGRLSLKLINSLVLTADYHVSAINQDLTYADSVGGNSDYFFIETRGDLSVYDALKTSISQSSKIGKIGATYERVSPNYETLGAYYFNNDFENITANFSTTLIPRVSLNMNAGYQHDNLNDQEVNSSNRFIYSVNGNVNATKKLMVNASVSNVQTYVHIRDIYDELSQTNPYQNLDTLSFTQLNFTTFLNVNYVLQSTERIRQNLNTALTYQQASEIQYDDTRFIGSKIYNGMLSYQYSLIPQKLNLSSTINYNQSIMPNNEAKVLSINLSSRKTFYEKFNASLIVTVSHSNNDINVINTRLSGGYIWLERHNFNLGITMVNNNSSTQKATQFGGNFTYSYMFDFNIKRENKKLNFESHF